MTGDGRIFSLSHCLAFVVICSPSFSFGYFIFPLLFYIVCPIIYPYCLLSQYLPLFFLPVTSTFLLFPLSSTHSIFPPLSPPFPPLIQTTPPRPPVLPPYPRQGRLISALGGVAASLLTSRECQLILFQCLDGGPPATSRSGTCCSPVALSASSSRGSGVMGRRQTRRRVMSVR